MTGDIPVVVVGNKVDAPGRVVKVQGPCFSDEACLRKSLPVTGTGGLRDHAEAEGGLNVPKLFFREVAGV